jgi:hypothetical protein
MSEAVVIVTGVGAAAGTRTAAAALACAASGPDRAGLLIDLADARSPRSSLIATEAACELEERLALHLPEGGVSSRGQTCHLCLPPDQSGIDGAAAALPAAREAVGVLHLPPSLLQPVLEETRIRPAAALLRAELREDRALTALAAGDLARRGVTVAVLKRPLGWIASRRALAGLLPAGATGGLPGRVLRRLLAEREGGARC